MPQTAATSPGTMANVAIGGSFFSWINPNNAKVSDNVYVTSSANMTPLYDKVVSLVLADGSYGAANKKTGLEWVSTADTYFSYGGAADVWGETLTGADVNDADFGVVLQVDQNGNAYSDYLQASNFGFSIPSEATIDGILVEIERNYVVAGRSKTPQVDHIRITVYYTELVTKTVQAKSRIKQAGVEKTIQAKGRILQIRTETIQAKSRILKTQTQTVQAKADIKKFGVIQTIQTKGRIKHADITKTIQTKARIKLAGQTKTIQARARMKLSVSRTVMALARIISRSNVIPLGWEETFRPSGRSVEFVPTGEMYHQLRVPTGR